MSANCVHVPLIIPLRLPIEGQHTNSLDNATQVEISSDTPLTQIYFTIDGSRPDPNSWKPRRPQPGPTYLFQKPFTLQEGTKTVKAMALIPGTNQESNVVTKTFEVFAGAVENEGIDNEARSVPLDYDFCEVSKNMLGTDSSRPRSSFPRRMPLVNADKDTNSNGHPSKKLNDKKEEYDRQENVLPSEGQGDARKISRGLNHATPKFSASDSFEDKLNQVPKTARHEKKSPSFDGDRRRKPASSNPNLGQLYRLQREVDIFNCYTCRALRPSNPNAVFCTTCGTPLLRLPSPINPPVKVADSDICITCGSRMSLTTKKCLVCEAPEIEEPDSMNRRLCSSCGSLNPIRVKFCLTCEAVLPFTAANIVNISTFLRNPAPTHPSGSIATASAGRSVSKCRICSRSNSLGTRFCDWCGIQEPCYVNPASQIRTCSVCPKCFWQTFNDSRFCPQCGFVLAGISTKSAFWNDTLRPLIRAYESEHRSLASLPPRAYKAVATQTVGLLCFGGVHNKPRSHPTADSSKRRIAVVAPVSPGKGLWRMQLEHLVAHLKAYTRNNEAFQKAIGRPRMGKMISAEVDETQQGEVLFCLTFESHRSSAQACTFDRFSGISMVEDSDQMGLSFPIATAGPQHQSNNNATELSHSMLMDSMSVSNFDAF